MDLVEFERRKKRAEKARTERDRTQGQLDSALERLLADFGCNDLDEAEAELAKLEKQAERTEKTYNKAADEFDEKWKEYADSMAS